LQDKDKPIKKTGIKRIKTGQRAQKISGEKEKYMNKRKIVMSCILIMLCFCLVPTYAVTYFVGESVQIEDTEKWEILSNEVDIDTINSKVKNVVLLRNKTNKTIEQEVPIQLEDVALSTKVENLSIKVNQAKVAYRKGEDGKVTFKIKADANAVKKIEIEYTPESPLKDAKIIKYSLESLKGKKIKAFKMDIHIQEEDIPLVKAIYPYHYTFENNTISVSYYDFTVNNLTKDVIVEKDTYKDLLYGREQEFDEAEEIIIKNARDWIKNGMTIDYEASHDKYSNYKDEIDRDKMISNIIGKECEVYQMEEVCGEIVSYAAIKQIEKDGKNTFEQSMECKRPLTVECIYPKLYKNEIVTQSGGEAENPYEERLVGKRICIDYVESEGDKPLYIYKNIAGSPYEKEGQRNEQWVRASEWEILKAPVDFDQIGYFSRRIYVGMDIEGNKIEATEKEKIEYVNSINADFYLRVMIYDGNVTIPERNPHMQTFQETRSVERNPFLL